MNVLMSSGSRRDQLSMLDFIDFLDLVRRAGLTDKTDHDHVVLRSRQGTPENHNRLKPPSVDWPH